MKRPAAQVGLISAFCLFWGVCRVGLSQPPDNWLPNGSFEKASRGQPAGWRTEKWGGQGTFQYATVARTGQRSVSIASDKGADIGWAATVPVEPYARYRLSGWIKTENVQLTNGRGALLNLHNLQPVATRALTGTNDWTRVEVEFDTDDQDFVQVNCLFGGWGLATGKAWYDDLRLEQIGKPAPQKPTITIDAAKTGEPISKYIYGQFIEHLGRCIYGGIWAEMIEDRKFYYPVGAKQSPWRPIGGTEVRMDKDNPFVGEHSPRLVLSGESPQGIWQEGLGLVAGQRYVGRVWLAGTPEAGPVRVSLIWGDGPAERQTVSIDKIAPEFTKTSLEFTAGKSTDNARLEIAAAGRGSLSVGTISLMPADHVQGMRADTLAVLRELDAPVYRWPGGNFVSGYDWREAIGDPDRRRPRKNPAWQGIEHHDFGLDEFIAFCRLVKADPYIVVNSGLGDVRMATQEVEYANGGPETPMGRLRAQNGHPEPYAVKFWGIGNEMYGKWQLGHMPLAQYINKHNEFAQAMRAVDPTIKLIAVGDVGPWSEGMMQHCAEQMDLISEHFYCQERPGLLGHMRQIPNAVRFKADAHRRYRKQFDSLKGKDIRIALDEWNYWYGSHVFGELGTRYFLKDALGIAAGLHEMARQSDMFFMANYAQTVNVIGAIKTSKTAAAFETTGLVLALYRKQFGVLPVATDCSRFLDAMAAWTEDRKTLTIGVINPSLTPLEIALELKGAKLTGSGTRWQIAGSDPKAYNDPGKPLRVTIEQAAVEGISKRLSVGPCSVTLFALSVQ
ncbi:MAG: alpha-L-arabinofuranosidase C-terminal domain-containing protein [Thermoguttaceae bacterium]